MLLEPDWEPMELPATQAAQMQALLREAGGMRDSNASLKLACVHQHGGCLTPDSRSTSIAHRLAWPQSGQSTGSGVGRAEDMPASLSPQRQHMPHAGVALATKHLRIGLLHSPRAGMPLDGHPR